MRRIVKSLAVLSVLALGACGGGGGSVLSFDNSSTADRVIITVQGPSNVARVLPGAVLPLSASSVKGSQNGYLSNNSYTWSATLVASGQYAVNPLGVTKPCQPILFQPAGPLTGSPPAPPPAFPYTADFSLYLTIDPTNESNVELIPPTIVPNPNPIPPSGPIPPGAGTLTVNFPYCIVVTATPRGGNANNAGSITVAVVSPSAPLN